jgi:hypothetical protein
LQPSTLPPGSVDLERRGVENERMSPMGEDQLNAIRERLNRRESVSVDDALFLARAVDGWQATVRAWVHRVEQLQDHVREIQWCGTNQSSESCCPACTVVEPGPHDPECWLWLSIRTA